MNLSELTAYAEEKYHIREEQKWDDFRSFSVLTDPETGKWVALMMRQWDYETGNELCRCDIKCGRQILTEINAPYVTNAFRMRGEKWAGVIFDDRTDPGVVFKLFDEAIRTGRAGGYTVVLEERKKEESSGAGGKVFRDTLLPLEAMRGNYDKNRFREKQEENRRIGPQTHVRRNNEPRTIPTRILEMMQRYDYGSSSFENKCRNFVRQGKFMEDYEDDAPWNSEVKRYFATYHDLNLNQLRGYFAWRTRVRRGEFHPITTSLAYMYIYELLNMIGVNTPEEAIRKMREFEKGFLDSGVGDRSMRENLHRWIMEFAVLSGSPKEEVLPLIDPDLIERDRQLMVLRKPQDHSDEEVFGALNALTGGKTEKSSAILKEPERGIHLFAEVWRYMAEHYDDCGWDIFAACFGKLRKFPWHPLANAVFLDQKKREEAEYKVTECRKFVCKNGEWSEIRYDELFFDRYRVHAIVHEADRQIRRYLKTGHYLREKKGEEWITPYVEAVIEKDRAAAEEAAKPKIMIDLSGLEKIRRDAQITRDSLLTEDEKREQAPNQTLEQAIGQVMKHAPELTVNPVSQHEEQQIVGAELPEAAEDSREEEKPAVIEIPSLDETHAQILVSVMRGEPVAGLIREKALMPSVVADAINEALFDEIGDNVLACEGDEITLVEDYREDLERILE
ncbi:MAG: TerB N-terminal domain-containing protein [Lachnospiraceae bacterium]|nr:TerB N-terminal domain-containing protein [Lachnospiraceae bacterium]